jgi:hypothetical protein
MREIPKKLRIAGYDYEVILDEDRNKDHGVSARGSCNAFYQKIWLDGSQPFEGLKTTLLHEILEAVNDHYEMGLNHHTICSLETVLYQVLKENRLVFFEEEITHESQSQGRVEDPQP